MRRGNSRRQGKKNGTGDVRRRRCRFLPQDWLQQIDAQ